MSFDSPQDNRAFAEKHGFPFPLLCDTGRDVGLAYRACERATDAYPRRITYVIDGEGVIRTAVETRDAAGQAEEILRAL